LPIRHGIFNEAEELVINFVHFPTFHQSAVRHAIESFHVINPGHAQIWFSSLAISDDSFVSL
jgi:hypothetical protein